MIDTHCHLNLSPLVENVDSCIVEAQEKGVNQFIIPGVDLDSSRKSILLAEKFTSCFAAIGIHPEEAGRIHSESIPSAIAELETLLKTSKDIKAIGECGLDLYRAQESDKQEVLSTQQLLFTEQIKLSQQFDLPVIIHVRDAQESVLTILDKHRPQGVLHCFSGDERYLHNALELGLYISFAGNVTFTNAQSLRDLLALVPVDRLLLETDAPFLNPDRGTFPNHPAQITQVYSEVSKIKGIPLVELEERITVNAKTLFNL